MKERTEIRGGGGGVYVKYPSVFVCVTAFNENQWAWCVCVCVAACTL